MSARIEAVGLRDLADYFERAPKETRMAARLALNTVSSRNGLKLIKDKMLSDIAFPAGYLNNDRIGLRRRATNQNLTTTISARRRATSLARFSSGVPGVKTNGVTVRVKRGRSTLLKQGFLVRLRKGASLSDDNYNIGLAVRLKPGDTIMNKKTTHQSWFVKGSIALLYGPSVDQVFKEVMEDTVDPILSMVEAEFHRQFVRLTRG